MMDLKVLLNQVLENIQIKSEDGEYRFRDLNRDELHDELLYCTVYVDKVIEEVHIYDDDSLYESMVKELNKLSDRDIVKINDWIKFKLED